MMKISHSSYKSSKRYGKTTGTLGKTNDLEKIGVNLSVMGV